MSTIVYALHNYICKSKVDSTKIPTWETAVKYISKLYTYPRKFIPDPFLMLPAPTSQEHSNEPKTLVGLLLSMTRTGRQIQGSKTNHSTGMDLFSWLLFNRNPLCWCSPRSCLYQNILLQKRTFCPTICTSVYMKQFYQ